jgi:hypothetical protein
MIAQAFQFTPAQRAVPMVAALVVMAFTLELIRRRKLREEYALLWVAGSVVFLVFAAWPKLLFRIRDWLGVYYLTAVFILGFTFLCLVVIGLSAALSSRADEACRLAQRLALLEKRLEDLGAKTAPPAAPPDATSASPDEPPAADRPSSTGPTDRDA